MVSALEFVLHLDMVCSLSFSHVVCLNDFGCSTNQSQHPLHFSLLTEKIFCRVSCFSFIKAAVIKQERFPAQILLHYMVSTWRHLFKMCSHMSEAFWALLLVCSEPHCFGFWTRHRLPEFTTNFTCHTFCWPPHDKHSFYWLNPQSDRWTLIISSSGEHILTHGLHVF